MRQAKHCGGQGETRTLLPQLPQFQVLVDKSVQTKPKQLVWPAGHVQVPATQEPPIPHCETLEKGQGLGRRIETDVVIASPTVPKVSLNVDASAIAVFVVSAARADTGALNTRGSAPTLKHVSAGVK